MPLTAAQTPIANGAIVSWTATLANGSGLTPDSLMGALNTFLNNAGWTINSYVISDISGFFNETFQVTAQIQNQSGYDTDGATFESIMVNACDDPDVTGAPPLSQSITQVVGGSAGGSAKTISTGQGGQTAPLTAKSATHVCGDPTWGFFDDPGQWFQCLATKGLSTLGLVFIGLAIGVVLIVTAQTKHSAGV